MDFGICILLQSIFMDVVKFLLDVEQKKENLNEVVCPY